MKPGRKRKPRRSPGGQPGNTNARKHGFYSDTLTPDQEKEFTILTEVQQVDPDFALFRVKFYPLLENCGVTDPVISAATKYLTSVCKSKYHLKKDDSGKVSEFIKRILEHYTALSQHYELGRLLSERLKNK